MTNYQSVLVWFARALAVVLMVTALPDIGEMLTRDGPRLQAAYIAALTFAAPVMLLAAAEILSLLLRSRSAGAQNPVTEPPS